MAEKHAFLSPSSSERWYHCPPSAWLCEQFPDLGSVYAAEGTEAHRLCEYLLKKSLGRKYLRDPRKNMEYYTPEMQDCCEGYAAFVSEMVQDIRARGDEPAVFVEQRVDLRMFIPQSMGTADCIVIGGNELVIVDFKYGMHPVPATSLQLRIYALGACEMFRDLYEFSSVRMVIYQPRLCAVDETRMNIGDLYLWAAQELKPRAELAFAGRGTFAAGEWCRNCRARRQCRFLAGHELEIAKYDFADPPLLSDEEIADVLSRVDMLIAWANSVREYALTAALSGRKFAGWKLVSGKSTRKFADDACAVARLEAAGVDPYEKKMLGVAGLEKKLGKKDFDNLLSDLVVRQAGKPVIVPENDKRPEFVPAGIEFDDKESI